MDDKKQVLYFFGAGASAKAIPVLKNWEAELEFFKTYFSENFQRTNKFDVKSSEDHENRTRPILEYIDFVLKEGTGHYTIDTFAKKLFLNDRLDDLKKLKIVIYLFLTYKENFRRSVADNSPYTKETQDNRYDTLLSFLFNKGDDKLPSHCKVVSWNYDTQFEKAFFPYVKDFNKLDSDVLSKPDQFLRINGSISSVIASSSSKLEATTYFRKILESGFSGLDDLVGLFGALDFLTHDRLGISYAFEKNKDNFEERLKAFNFSNLSCLVIVGYSFPFFNREYDEIIIRRFLIESQANGKTIYLQYPESKEGGNPFEIHENTLEKLNEIVEHITRKHSFYFRLKTDQPERNVVFIKDTDTFYVPYGV
jgi:hypothetical protein